MYRPYLARSSRTDMGPEEEKKEDPRRSPWLEVAAAETSAIAAAANHEGYRAGINDAFRAIGVLAAVCIATWVIVSRQEGLK